MYINLLNLSLSSPFFDILYQSLIADTIILLEIHYQYSYNGFQYPSCPMSGIRL